MSGQRGSPRGISITTKLAVLFGSATIALIAITNLALYRFVEHHWDLYDRRNLEVAADALQLVATTSRSPVELAGREANVAARLSHNGRVSFAILDAAGNTLLTTLRDDVPEALVSQAASTGDTLRWRPAGGQAYQVMVAPASMGSGIPLRMVILLQVTSHLHMSRILAEALLGITLASGLIAAGLGYLISRQGLAPLRRFAATAGHITASRLGERLDTSELPQEVRELADSFNHMLERLQDSFRRIEQSSSDLAHEMRTPINTLLGQTQVALSRARTPAEYREVLASNAEEYERLSRMIQDMLFIARADEPHAVLDVEDVELRDEARRVAEFYEPMLDEKRIRLECHGAGTARADRALVGRALANLLSNAVRHSPPDGRIDIDIGTDPVAPDCISLSVVNQGPAIAPEDMPRIFDRFYRASTGARTEGTGLGLAIVKTIAQLHGGSVGATSELGQTRFILRLPAGSPGPAHAEPVGFRPALAQRS